MKDVYKMTWAEFQLRLIGFNKAELRHEYKLRRLAWITYIAPHQDPKKMRGLTENKWWRIGGDKKRGVSEDAKALFLERAKEFYKKQNG